MTTQKDRPHPGKRNAALKANSLYVEGSLATQGFKARLEPDKRPTTNV
jgi:hypothetical protein